MSPESRSQAVARVLAEIDEVEVEIEKLVAGGDGIARYQGVPLFVPRSAPGDRVRARVVERHAHYGRAEILEILSPGSGRREPPCRFFARCGGCDLQHLEDGLQLELKVAAARETLERIGGIVLPERQQVVAGAAWGYRLRTQLQVRRGERSSAVGYFERGSHELVAVDSCPVLVPALERELRLLPARLAGVDVSRLDLAAGDEGVGAAPVVANLPHGELSIAVGETTYHFDARTFFQGHRELLGELVEAVVGSTGGERAVDLYAGVGLFSIPLARRFERVEAVEGDRIAARFCRKNARLNRVDGLEVTAQAVESRVGGLPDDLDLLVVDPPRAGLPLGVRGALLVKRPRRIVYVSCHPAALARDLKALGRLYELEKVVFLDLFPQTAHLETVAHLVRREDPPEAV